MVLLIDNYDSFVHNLARYLRKLGQETTVVRNDAVRVDEVMREPPAAIVLSPGPCTPVEAGCSLDLVRAAAGRVPLLGVCLGHQAIAAALGGQVVRAREPMHGRASRVRHTAAGLFEGLPNPLTVGRYHSLVVERESLTADLEVTAEAEDGTIMALAHRRWAVFGVQFHPESILTESGFQLLANFLTLADLEPRRPALAADDELAAPPAARQLPDRPVTF